MRTGGRFIVGSVVFLVVTPAHPQTPSKTPRFIDLALGADWDDARTNGVPGATLASGLALGFDWGTSGVELDVGVPLWHVNTRTYPPYQYAGPSYEGQQHDHSYVNSTTVRRRSIDVTVLHRTNVPINRQVTVTGLFGGGKVFRPEQFTSVTKELLPGGQLIEVSSYQGSSSGDYLAAVVGLEGEFKVSPRVSVVPRLRITVFPSLSTTWPGRDGHGGRRSRCWDLALLNSTAVFRVAVSLTSMITGRRLYSIRVSSADRRCRRGIYFTARCRAIDAFRTRACWTGDPDLHPDRQLSNLRRACVLPRFPAPVRG